MNTSLAAVIALLQMATLLLNQAQHTPNLPPSLKEQATTVALTAISAAKQYLATQPINGTVSSQSSQNTSTSGVGQQVSDTNVTGTTCTAKVDKTTVEIGESFSMSWTATKAVSAVAQFRFETVPGLNNQDPINSYNAGKTLSLGVPGVYTRDMLFFDGSQTNSPAKCTISVTVKVNPTKQGSYEGYVNDVSTATGSYTYDGAISACKSLVAQHQSDRVSCRWNGNTILQNYGGWSSAG